MGMRVDGCCIELSCDSSRDQRPKGKKSMYVCNKNNKKFDFLS